MASWAANALYTHGALSGVPPDVGMGAAIQAESGDGAVSNLAVILLTLPEAGAAGSTFDLLTIDRLLVYLQQRFCPRFCRVYKKRPRQPFSPPIRIVVP
jgi:hypothetical protein